MWKILIIVVLLLGAGFGIPQARGKISPVVSPVLDKLGPVGDALSRPAKRWAAKSEITILIRKLAEEHAERKELPSPIDFPRWIKSVTRGSNKGLDPWGHPYYLVHTEHDVTVGSQGPDRKRNTPDDIRVRVPFE